MKSRRLLILLAFVCLAPLSEAASQIAPPELDIEGASAVYELAENVPPGIQLLQLLGVSFVNKLANDSVEDALNQIWPTIDSQITDKRGFLLKVNVYVHENGTPHVPGGQLLTTIGLGSEPLDALAEFYRQDVLTNPVPRNLRNSSSYIWIAKSREGRTRVWHIPKEARQSLESLSNSEAKKRERLASFYAPAPQNNSSIIQRADYWAEVYRAQSEAIADKEIKDRLAANVAEMLELQTKANELQRRYDNVVMEIAEHQKSLNVLNAIDVVSDIIKAGLDSGLIGGNKISTQAKPELENRSLIESRKVHVKVSSEIKVQIHQTINVYYQDLHKKEAEIVDDLKSGGIEATPPDPIPPVIP